MKNINFKETSHDTISYIKTLENQVQELQIHVDKLNEMLANAQKALYGRSSEKSCYVLGEQMDQLSMFNLFMPVWTVKKKLAKQPL